LKRITVLILALSLVLSGCLGSNSNETEGNTKTTPNAAAINTDAVNPAGVLPITNEKTTISVLVNGSATVENFATNEFTKWLEEKTNIHIKWEIAPPSAAVEKLNLVLSSGDFPDVIMGFGVTPSQRMIYGSDGIFIPLNDLIEKYGVETKRVFKELPIAKELVTAGNGKIYALSYVNQCYHCTHHQRMWMYQPWLDKLGLKTPTTTEEFYQVLKAFKEKDPNGNGKADEIPLTGSPNNYNTSIDSFLMNAFIINNGASKLYVDKGKIEVSYNKPEWKEGLEYIRKLYAEGLIAPQTFTQDGNQLKQLGENPIPIMGAASAHNMISITQQNAPTGRWLEYLAVPALKGPKGVQLAALAPFPGTNGDFIITKNAKNPEAAFRLADFMYREETTLRWFSGREGVEWRRAEKGEIGINGKPAIWKQITPWGAVGNTNWSQRGLGYISNDLKLGDVADPKNPLELRLYEETKTKMEPYSQTLESVVPPLYFSAEDAREIAELEKTLLDHMKEMVARFVTGDADLGKGWDSYLQNLNDMNLKKYLEIYQKTYDQKYKK
jgi:putative aldouronate transport system substrate-binding protein